MSSNLQRVFYFYIGQWQGVLSIITLWYGFEDFGLIPWKDSIHWGAFWSSVQTLSS